MCPFLADKVSSSPHILGSCIPPVPSAVGCSAAMSEDPDLDTDVAEPFRFHFEVAYEVANKGACVCAAQKLDLVEHLCAVILHLCGLLMGLGTCKHVFEALRRGPLAVYACK